MAISPLEACDLIRFADATSERLAAACAELSRRRGLEREKGWMQTAVDVLDEARRPAAGLIDRARTLPELAELRDEFAATLQNAWVDALEKLVAGITFHVSGRSPIIEALFPNQKFPPLRKAPRESLEKYQRDYQKRLKSGYVTRMLATEDFGFAGPVLELIDRAWAEYLQFLNGEAPAGEDLETARAALIEAGERIDLAVRQAKLLAEAALAPLPGAFEQSGLAQKLKKRAGRAAAVEPEPLSPPELEEAEDQEAAAEVLAGDPEQPGAPEEEAEAASSASAEVEAPAPAESVEPVAADEEPAPTEVSPAPAEETGTVASPESGTGAAPEPAPVRRKRRRAAAQD